MRGRAHAPGRSWCPPVPWLLNLDLTVCKSLYKVIAFITVFEITGRISDLVLQNNPSHPLNISPPQHIRHRYGCNSMSRYLLHHLSSLRFSALPPAN